MGTRLDPLDLMAALVDDVGRWGDGATDLQWSDAEAILNLDGPRRHWLGRAKGYSKTRDVAGMSLVALLTQFPAGAHGYVAAVDGPQAGLLRQSISDFASNTPELRDQVNISTNRVTTRHGADLTVLAADSAGAHGLRPYWMVVDELGNWPDTRQHRELFDNLWAGLPKVKKSRGIIITTAGTPAHFSKRIYDTAAAEESWRLSDIKGPAPWMDADEVAAEQRRLFPSVYLRLFYNEWCSADDSIAEPSDVEAACVLKGPIAPEQNKTYVCTLDLGTRVDRTAAVIAHAERSPEGTRVIADRLQVWTPRPGQPVSLDDVRLWITEMCRAYRAKLLYDPSQAYLMVEQLRKSGIRCQEFVFSPSSVGRIATAIMQALRRRMLTLPDDQLLRDELLAVRLRETSPNVMRIDHHSGGHDDQAIAVAMAVYELTSRGGAIGAAEWLEHQAPIHGCGQPNPRSAYDAGSPCTKCGQILEPLPQEPQPAEEPQVAEAPEASWSSSMTQRTLATIDFARKQGWERTEQWRAPF